MKFLSQKIFLKNLVGGREGILKSSMQIGVNVGGWL